VDDGRLGHRGLLDPLEAPAALTQVEEPDFAGRGTASTFEAALPDRSSGMIATSFVRSTLIGER
jgi:hypothetical protein